WGECTFGPAPHLLPAARSLRFPAPYLVVDVDRAGADIRVIGTMGDTDASEEVEGSQDLLHKVRGGGWAHRRMQARVQDSWDRNASEVAAQVDRVVARETPVAILLDGDPYAVSALERELGEGSKGLVKHLTSG